MASRRSDLSLAPPATEGLSALDRDRAGSVADEGGASAAAVEAREDESFADEGGRRRPANGAWRAAALLAAGAFGVFTAWSVARRRGRS
jgi:hypothetical protein